MAGSEESGGDPTGISGEQDMDPFVISAGSERSSGGVTRRQKARRDEDVGCGCGTVAVTVAMHREST